MPGIFTHYIAGHKVLDKITDPAVKSIVENNERIFEFGLQGPDFFKYYKAPFKSDDAVTRICMALRERTINEWLFTVYRYIKQQSEEDAAILRPYFLGYLVYYRVNCALNPYISYRCGFQTPGADLPERFEVYRNMFTTALDELFHKHYLNKTPAEMDIDKIFWVTYAELLEITRLYPLHLKRILGREISREDAIKAAQDMNRLAKKRIRPGMLSLTVPVYETFSKTVYKGTYSSSRYGKISPSIDYLNEEHKEWFLPWDNRTPQTESAYELFEKGIDDAAALIEKVAHGFGGELGDLQVQEILGNDSMLTGVAWNAPFLPRYYDCVYKQEEAKIAKKLKKLEEIRLKNE